MRRNPAWGVVYGRGVKTNVQNRATGFTRQADIVRGATNKAGRTFNIALSSETPVTRDSYVEVLSHEPGDIDLTRLECRRSVSTQS